MTLQDLKIHTDKTTAQRIVNVLREHIPSSPSVKGSRINAVSFAWMTPLQMQTTRLTARIMMLWLRWLMEVWCNVPSASQTL